MAKHASALGRGLDALLPDLNENPEGVREIGIGLIDPNPDQPRRTFPEEGLAQLAESIRQQGLLQPVLVTPEGGRYRLVAGERRWRAARKAGLETIPCVVREMSLREQMEAALIENLQREDLNPAEEARALQELKERLALTQEELAQRLGKSRSMVANSLRLLQLPQAALESLEEGAISAGHARSLLALAPDGDAMAGFLARMLAYKLSVRDCEDAVAHWKKQGRLPWSDGGEAPKKAPARRRKSPEFKQLEKSLGTLLKVKTSLSGTPAKGRISLSYASEDELMRLLGLLGLKDVKEAAAEGQDSEAE